MKPNHPIRYSIAILALAFAGALFGQAVPSDTKAHHDAVPNVFKPVEFPAMPVDHNGLILRAEDVSAGKVEWVANPLQAQVDDLTRQVNATNQIIAMLQEQRAYWNKTASDIEIQMRLAQTEASNLQKQVNELKKPAPPPAAK